MDEIIYPDQEEERVLESEEVDEVELDERQLEEDAQYKNPPQW